MKGEVEKGNEGSGREGWEMKGGKMIGEEMEKGTRRGMMEGEKNEGIDK